MASRHLPALCVLVQVRLCFITILSLFLYSFVMIIHVFKITTFHLNQSIIRAMCNIASVEDGTWPFFLVFGPKNEQEKKKHVEMFAQIGVKDYEFVENPRSLYAFGRRHRNIPFLLHGTTYTCMGVLELAGVKVNWICWGAGSSINRKSVKSMLSTPLKMLIYHKFCSIKALMSDDKTTLERDFLLKGVGVLPYYSYNILLHRDKIEEERRKKRKQVDRVRILLGNSAHNINYYYDVLPLLARFKGLVTVNCMMQYPKKDEQTLNHLCNKGRSLMGDDAFFLDMHMLDFDEYIEYMSGFDIYICGTPTQSGLGAAAMSLMLGKKVVLTGKNLNWIRSQEYVVFDVDDIDGMSERDFLADLSEEQKDRNFENAFSRIEERRDRWVEYMREIFKQTR